MAIFLLLFVGFVAGSPVSQFRDPMMNEGMFEGDIAGVPPDGDRNAVVHASQLWPNGVIPYVISPESENIRDQILKGMKHIESNSCLRFKPRVFERDYIKIIKDTGCYSHWGRTGGEQPVSLGVGCDNFAVVVHELMHAIGFEHEHNRSDRDDYLIINWQNIENKWFFAFKKLRADQNRLLTGFDFKSLMLYGSRSFAKDYWSDKYSMVTKDGRYIPDTYHRTAMSVSDALRIKMLYGC